MRQARVLAVAVLALLVMASCSSRNRRQQANNYPPVKISIDNQNFYDATVYLNWRGDRRRLGVVTGNSRGTFESRWFGPEVTIEVELLAGGRHRADPMSINPGEELVVEIPANIDRFRIIRRG